MEILSSSPEKTEKLGMKDMEILSTIYQLFRSVSLDSTAYHSKNKSSLCHGYSISFTFSFLEMELT
jgi:hypothetical protein